MKKIIIDCLKNTTTRFDFWINFCKMKKIKEMAELGVYKGEFASTLLEECNSIEKYYLVDTWCHRENWNKPLNHNDKIFKNIYLEAKRSTNFVKNKRIILRGKTNEMASKIPDSRLDFVYIDGDHTLRGITSDLICMYPKVKVGGWIGGDDFVRNVWQHQIKYEPTLVFPFAIYFAESVGDRIYALPYSQFLIEKNDTHSFEFIDLVGVYNNLTLRHQFYPINILKLWLHEIFSFLKKI